MLQDQEAGRENHERFIRRVAATEIVWGLRAEEGFAYCESNESERDVLMFWSDRAYASRVRRHSFPEHEPIEISLFDFLFRWLPGMTRDAALAGANWTGDLVGLESEPEEMQRAIVNAMKPELVDVYQTRFVNNPERR